MERSPEGVASSSARPAARLPGVLAGISCALIALPILYTAGEPLATADLWWQLALGRAYVDQGLALPADPLTHTALQPPPPHQWLFAVGAHAIERAAGFPGLRAFHALAVAAILALAFSELRRAAPSLPP